MQGSKNRCTQPTPTSGCFSIFLGRPHVGFADLPQTARIACSANVCWTRWGFTLERFALHSVENCPDKPVRLAFDSDIHSDRAGDYPFRDGLLRLDAAISVAPTTSAPFTNYSLAVHVIDESGERVAQGDVPASALVPSSRCAAKST